MNINNIALVFVGGALGSVCRFSVGLIVSLFHVSLFFVGTFIANLVGCFIIGLLAGKTDLSKKMNLLLVTGFCGGFTTFSTFSKESLELIQGGQLGLALSYNIGSILLGVLLVWLGYKLTHKNKVSA